MRATALSKQHDQLGCLLEWKTQPAACLNGPLRTLSERQPPGLAVDAPGVGMPGCDREPALRRHLAHRRDETLGIVGRQARARFVDGHGLGRDGLPLFSFVGRENLLKQQSGLVARLASFLGAQSSQAFEALVVEFDVQSAVCHAAEYSPPARRCRRP